MAQQARKKTPSHGTGAMRREQLRKQRIRQARWRKIRLPLGIAVVILLAGGIFLATRSDSPSTTASTSSGDTSSGDTASGATPAPASAFVNQTSAATTDTIDGIPCESGERLTYHVHSHLAVYVDGTAQTIPQGIGINQTASCIYWLHSHTPDGVVHVEAPEQKDFTLGQYFDVWGQPLTTNQVATAAGAVTAYVDGQPFTGDPRTIPLSEKTVVQLDVGTVVPPAPYNFPGGL